MAKYTDKHDVAENIHIYKQENSKNWYVRFKLDNTWFTKSTKERDKQKALVQAVRLQTEFRIMLDNKIPIKTSRKLKKYYFATVALQAIERMQKAGITPTFERHIAILQKYHMPFFGRNTIKDINKTLLTKFDKWRAEKIRRTPAKSTVKKHNAAMQRVLDEAVIQNYITQSEVPVLPNAGADNKRRAAFTKREYKIILEEAKNWIDESRNDKTKLIRESLYYYMQVATGTGLRPGSEMEHLKWSDVETIESKGECYMTFTVRKGKTTNYTGTREIIVKDHLDDIILDDLYEFCDVRDHDLDEYMFRLDVAKSSNVYGKNFSRLLKRLNLEYNAHGKRTLYSLRHSYITWELQAGTGLQALSKQCGTSVEMIERYYSHVVPSMFADQLSDRYLNKVEQ